MDPLEERWLTTREVAELFYVGSATISRWAKERRLPHVRTLGGHARFPESAVLALRERITEPARGDAS